MTPSWLDVRPSAAESYTLLDHSDWRTLAPFTAILRERGWGTRVSYSRKVFVPLTQLCRDVCHYCTFAQTPRRLVTYRSVRPIESARFAAARQNLANRRQQR